ncbi:hypothetical protein [Thermotoga sp. SG1]|uniref:hypothetical protein n=1 Tax=Thermotoga sp. SG1 TaxID=126739 RepID=UPI000C78FE11|nr:hypothetical protein [Thermotoga sp. SG1]PLV56655.1 hypothetical protein AS006_03355 [Thermotoga sp. SG1]
MRVFFLSFLLLLAAACALTGPDRADLYVYLFNIGVPDGATVDLEESSLSVNGKEYSLEFVLREKGFYLTTVDIPFDTKDLLLDVNATVVTEEQTMTVSFSANPVVLFHEIGEFETTTILEDNTYLLLDLENKRVFAVEDPVRVSGEISQERSVVTLTFDDYEMKVPVYNGEFLFYPPRPFEIYDVNVFFDDMSTSLTLEEGRDEYEVTF